MQPGPAPAASVADMPTEQTSGGVIDKVLFAAALILFLVTRFDGLDRYPIYFFCDEAVLANRAADYVANGFRDSTGHRFPTYFRNVEYVNLSVSVYAQVVPVMLFPKSIVVTRGTVVVLVATAMAALGLMLRDFFKLRFWWAGLLVLSATPGWFLHTRTAFDPVLATGLYIWFLYFYLRYRAGKVCSLFPALLFGALTFYAYNAFQPVIALTALLLLAADFPYHWRQRRVALWGIPLIALLAFPYVRFLKTNPDEMRFRLKSLDSYWVAPNLTTARKLQRFGKEYLHGFSPGYWLQHDSPEEIPRHKMLGYGQISWLAVPFAAAGLAVCFRKARSPAHRALVFALAAAPVGGAMAQCTITRTMTLVVAVAMLATLGLDLVLRLAARVIPSGVVAAAVFVGLTYGQVAMLHDALTHGTLWYRDYGLYGLQWGAKEVFGEARRSLARRPSDHVVISPVWANGTDELFRFFLNDDPRAQMQSVNWYQAQRRDLDERTLFIQTATEYDQALGDPLFRLLRHEGTIPYPDGTRGFEMFRMAYSSEADALFAAEKAARHRLVTDRIELGGETVEIGHSAFDMGSLAQLFDKDSDSLAKTNRVNPAVLEVRFPSSHSFRSVTVAATDPEMQLTVSVFPASGGAPLEFHKSFHHLPPNPTLSLTLEPRPPPATKLRIEILALGGDSDAYVHLREVSWE
jgi:hypothetical protein